MNTCCQIGHSAFPDECIFHLILWDGTDHIGAAAREYCRTRTGQPLAPDQPLPGRTLAGLVAARVIRREGEDGILLSLPDGAIVLVRKDQMRLLKKGPVANTRFAG